MSKAVFPEKPAVRPLAGSDYELAQDFYFLATIERVWDVVIHVMPGFRTDGASIPRLLWRIFGSPYDPDIFAAAIAHDALYRGEIVPRKDADAAFLRMMEESGVPKRKRRLVWRGVRWFGWITWLRHTKASVEEARRYIEMDFATQAIRKDQTRFQHLRVAPAGDLNTASARQQAVKFAKALVVAAALATLAGCIEIANVESFLTLPRGACFPVENTQQKEGTR